MPTVYTRRARSLADPIRLNSRLGTYTNFVNLLDLCGLAVPAAMRADGMPFGITLLAPGGRDALLASLGRVFHADTGTAAGRDRRGAAAARAASGATGAARSRSRGRRAHVRHAAQRRAANRSARASSKRTTTAPDYRLFALAGARRRSPACCGSADGGRGDRVEVWALPAEGFGRFVAAIPPPPLSGRQP